MNSLPTLAGSPLVQRLGWALLHSVWQVMVVAIGLALVLPLVRKRSAHAAYLVCCAALLLTGLAPAITFSLLPSRSTAGAVARETGTSPAAMVSPESLPVFREMPRNEPSPAGRLAPSTVDRVAASPHAARSLPVVPTATVSVNDRVLILGRVLLAKMSSWLPWIVLVWASGVLALSLWNVGGWLALQKMKSKAAEPVSVAIQEAAARIARKLGLIRVVRLMQSAIVDSPIVIGAIKPVILLPACLVTQLPPDQLESILAHELAHVLRQDYLVNLLQTAIETLLFYHPAVWWISSQVRIEREHCCDDIAVRLVSDRAIYVKALAAVAGARGPAMAPAATGGSLLPRLRRVLGITDPRSVHPAGWLVGAVLLSLCAGTAAFVAIDARSARAQTEGSKPPEQSKRQESTQATTKGSIQIKVVDAAGRPLPGAGIQVANWEYERLDEPFEFDREFTTDAQGVARIELPKTLSVLGLVASRSGYAAMCVNMQTSALFHKLTIPDEFTFRLPKGTTVGGVVKDEDGQPIRGARVAMSYESGGVEPGDRARPSFSQENTMTDADGRWKLEDAPPGDDVEFSLGVTHPDYISSDRWRELERKQAITTKSLREQTATIVMQRGNEVIGKVTDPQGKPVEMAVVTWGDRPYPDAVGRHVAHTNREGVYRFGALPLGKTTVTVVADGWMPDSRKVEVARRTQSADFQLKPGKRLRIKIVDRAGNPVPGVHVFIHQWRGVEALTNYTPQAPDTTIPARSNGDGIFEWTWAPDDAVTYRFLKVGFAEAKASIAADDGEHVQIIDPELHISGRVRDSQTGETIDKFLAIPIIFFRPNFPSLSRDQARQQNAGAFNVEFRSMDVEHGVQIEAPGYRTYRSPRYRIGDANPVLDVRMQPAERYVGQIVNQDGSAMKDTPVYISTALDQLSHTNLEVEDMDTYRTKTDDDGAFELAAPIDRYGLVVIAPEGYAEVTREPNEKPGVIRVQPWAKVTGRLMQSGKPVPRCEVMLQPIRGGDGLAIFHKFQCDTGDEGSFVFERVPPGPCCVAGYLHWAEESPLRSSASVPLHPRPGQHVDVNLGGGDVEVIGQLMVENEPAGFDYHFSLSYLVARRPGIEPPEPLAAKGFDWRKGWSDLWLQTFYLETLHNWFVKPEPDGRFTISGVEPGDYEFAVHLYGSTEGCLVHPVATRVIGITVKPGQSQLDLGKLSIPALTLPKVGDLASDFDLVGLNGVKTNLAGLRGQYVLLDFWATWCAPCVAKLDEVERTRQQYSADLRLVVVGVNLDADGQRAKDFLKARQLPWYHALLGDWSSTDVPRRYAISSIPAYVLIDPDGRIVDQKYSLEKIAATLESIDEKSGSGQKTQR